MKQMLSHLAQAAFEYPKLRAQLTDTFGSHASNSYQNFSMRITAMKAERERKARLDTALSGLTAALEGTPFVVMGRTAAVLHGYTGEMWEITFMCRRGQKIPKELEGWKVRAMRVSDEHLEEVVKLSKTRRNFRVLPYDMLLALALGQGAAWGHPSMASEHFTDVLFAAKQMRKKCKVVSPAALTYCKLSAAHMVSAALWMMEHHVLDIFESVGSREFEKAWKDNTEEEMAEYQEIIDEFTMADIRAMGSHRGPVIW
ncbi:hypothetical protein EJ06DRAFT_552095 [Trichodelitschia bisporula]|uniref:Uncharacterized protein n=1 Tax=Trichodelitschia bisporula TaxID=703511 RepID=A0A6G1HIQ4_9PEZI|nr:hypothetical protein EJ06DRAFT_552095 [Trichodelitschia bisporula]